MQSLFPLAHRTPLLPSPGIFKQLDPEGSGTIELDLISVSLQLPRPALAGGC